MSSLVRQTSIPALDTMSWKSSCAIMHGWNLLLQGIHRELQPTVIWVCQLNCNHNNYDEQWTV